MTVNVLDLAMQRVEMRRAAATKGGEYWGPCPGCGDGGKGPKSNRFHVWPEENGGRGRYWCRQCGKSGDAIQFLRDFEGLSFREACARLQIDVPAGTPYKAPRPPKDKSQTRAPKWRPEVPGPGPDDRWKEKASALVRWASDCLHRDPERLEWLSRRGIKEITAHGYRLGWNPGDDRGRDLYRPRESWGLPTETKSDGSRKRLWIPRGLVIPGLDRDYGVTRIRIRRPEGEPRYYVLPGSSMECFVRPRIHRAYMIVESELDAILLDQEASDLCGFVALGNSSRKPDAETHRVLLDAGRILVALDYDDAGGSAVRWWCETYPQAIPFPVPEGKDPGEAWAAGVNLREWVAAGLPAAWHIRP